MKKILNALGEPIKHIHLDAKGSPIILTEKEQKLANYLQKQISKFDNALGAEIDITSLTTIIKKVSEQKFFQIRPSDYLPVRVGEGAWSSNLVTYRSFQTGGKFSEGVLNQAGGNGRMAEVGSAVDSVMVEVKNWGKKIGWTLMELQQASKSGNWDLITNLEESRKTNWDLGIQAVSFLGLEGTASVKGLLTQTVGTGAEDVTENTSLITKAIKDMSATELSTFAKNVLDVYRTNCQRTAWPTHFIIPESDYLGLATPSNSDYPLKSKMEILQDTLRVMTNNPNFRILPLAYADAAYNGLDKQIYTMLNYDDKSIRMDVPVAYTNTLANTVNGFNFENVGYGQFTGVKAYRPKEMIYFTYDPTP